MKKRVGIRIKTLRENRSITQAQLSEEIGRTTHAISAIEQGKSLPSFATLEKLSLFLKVPVKDFFDVDVDDQSTKGARLLSDIIDMLREMDDKDLETARDLIKAFAQKK